MGLLRSFSDASNSTRRQRLLLAVLTFVRDDRDVYPTEIGPGRRFHQRVKTFFFFVAYPIDISRTLFSEVALAPLAGLS